MTDSAKDVDHKPSLTRKKYGADQKKRQALSQISKSKGLEEEQLKNFQIKRYKRCKV